MILYGYPLPNRPQIHSARGQVVGRVLFAPAPARAASQVRLGVWGLAPAKRQPNRNANSMHPKSVGMAAQRHETAKH